ncbi:MAG: hypothetical protein M3347_15915, partial [Armatimonadota bacterium]|nr:hypothetical protein [Armatimonadota bacterium]
MSEEQLPSRVADINLVLQACDPAKPLEPGDPRYMDFSDLRQGEGIGLLKTELSAPLSEGQFHHRCLCGHRGSGKSTELLALQKWANENGFLAAIADVEGQFGAVELEFSDLFLLAAMTVESAMQAKHLNVPNLPKDKVLRVISCFDERIKESKQTTKSELAVEAEAQLGASIPLVGKLIAKFTSDFKAGVEQAVTTRRQIRNFPDTL